MTAFPFLFFLAVNSKYKRQVKTTADRIKSEKDIETYKNNISVFYKPISLAVETLQDRGSFTLSLMSFVVLMLITNARNHRYHSFDRLIYMNYILNKCAFVNLKIKNKSSYVVQQVSKHFVSSYSHDYSLI